MKTLSIGQMLEHINGLCDANKLTVWESVFVKSCYNVYRLNKLTSELTDSQVDKIDEIYNKY